MRAKPTRIKASEGDKNKIGKHKLQAKLAAEPRAEHGLPPASEHLPARAREVYEMWREQLAVMEIDHKPDKPALEAASMAYCRAVEAEIVVTRDGIIVKEAVLYRGRPIPKIFRIKRHPASTTAVANWLLVKAFVTEFGLTPAARSRLTVERKTNESADVHALLAGPAYTPDEKQKLQ